MSAAAPRGWTGGPLAAVIAVGFGILVAQGLLAAGVHVTGDSGAYARSAAALAGAGGELSPLWPPLFPALLAALTALAPLSVLDAAALINGASAGIALWAALALGRAAGLGGPGSVAAALALAATPAVQGVFLCAWSEALAAAALLVHLAAAAAAARAPARTGPWAVAAFAAATLSMTRYAGVLAPAALFALAFGARRAVPLALAAAAHLPLVAWAVFQRLQTGHAFGDRRPTPLTVVDNLQRMAEELSAVDQQAPAALPIAAVALLAGLGAALRRGRSARLLVGFGLLHLIGAASLLLWATSTVAMDRINPRLLHPVVLSAWALAALSAGAAATTGGHRSRPAAAVFGAALLLSTLGAVDAGPARARTLMRGGVAGAPPQQGGWQAGPGPAALAEAFAALAPPGRPRWALLVTNVESGALGSWALLHRRAPGAPAAPITVLDSAFVAETPTGPLHLLSPTGRLGLPHIGLAVRTDAPPNSPGLLLLTPRAARQLGLQARLRMAARECVEGPTVAGLHAWRCLPRTSPAAAGSGPARSAEQHDGMALESP